MIALTPRKEIPLSLTLLTPVVAIALTLVMGAVIFATLGYDPAAALYQFFIAPVSRPDRQRACLCLPCQCLEYRG